MIHRLLVLCVGVAFLWPPAAAHAYELRTHGEITRRAYKGSEGFGQYLLAVGISTTQTFATQKATPRNLLARFDNDGTALGWMIEGAIREDDFSRSLIGITLGCVQPQNPPSEMDRSLNHFLDVQRGGKGLSVGLNLGLPASDWALGRQGRGEGSSQNQFSLPDVRDYQYRSLVSSTPQAREINTALMFRGLGQVLHVLEDMAQPQHTRNDPHADCADAVSRLVGGHSWYEDYIEARALGRSFRQVEVPSALVLDGYGAVDLQQYENFFSDSNLRGLADFSSRNFLSAGTNLGGSLTPCTGLIEPPCEEPAYAQVSIMYSVSTLKGTVAAPLTFYTRAVVDKFSNRSMPAVPLTSRSIWDEFLESLGQRKTFTLNRYNYDAMADILLPRAVGYAAGFLDTFFRGSMGATLDDVGLMIAGSNEPMVGDFKFLYETPDGTRTEMVTWNLRIEPDSVTAPLSLPNLSPDTAPETTCWLVFRGQLGFETDGVVASRAPCPFAPPPPPPRPWYVYLCATFNAADNYFYATLDPPWEGGPILHFQYRQESTATIFSCSLKSHGATAQPPGALTEHPA